MWILGIFIFVCFWQTNHLIGGVQKKLEEIEKIIKEKSENQDLKN